MNVLKRSLICLTLLISCTSSIYSGAQCPTPGDQLVFLSDFAPEPGVEGTTFGYTPFELLDQARSTASQQFVKGFDVEVAAEVAKRIGFTDVAFKQVAFSDIFSDLFSEESIAISAISTTQERIDDETVQLVIYKENDPMAIILPTSLVNSHPRLQDPITVLQELNTISETNQLQVDSLTASRQETILANETLYGNLSRISVVDVSLGIQDLLSGEATGLFTDEPVAREIIDSLPGFTVIAPVPVDVARDNSLAPQTSQGLGIAIRNSATDTCNNLINAVTDAINDMRDDGTLAALCARLTNENDIDNFLFDKHCAVALPVIDNDTAPEVDGA